MQMSGGAVHIGDAVEPREPQKTRSLLGTLSFTQLYVLVLIVVFSASGLVCLEDVVFVLLSSVYIFIVSKVAFPDTSATSRVRAYGKTRLFTLYVGTGGVVGLLLPLAYIFGGFVEGDKKGVEAAAPHVFLLSCQVFLEGLSYALEFSLPGRAMVPVFYNTKRIFTILDWLRADFWKQTADLDLPSFSSSSAIVLWVRFGWALAVANLVFWSFNLFCFLIPVYLPKAFRIYHQKETTDAILKEE